MTTSGTFTCMKCGQMHPYKDMAAFSKKAHADSLYNKLSSGDQFSLTYCRFCLPADNKNLPPAVAKWVADREYWESRVTEAEIHRDVPPARVDKLLTNEQVRKEYGITAKQLGEWVGKGWLKPDNTLGSHRIRQSELIEVMREQGVSFVTPLQTGQFADPGISVGGTESKPIGGGGNRPTIAAYFDREKTLAYRLYTERRRRDLSQEDMAKLMGRGSHTVRNVELVNKVAPDTLAHVEKWLDENAEPFVQSGAVGTVVQPNAPWEVEDKVRIKELEAEAHEMHAAISGMRKWVAKYRAIAPQWGGWDELPNLGGK